MRVYGIKSPGERSKVPMTLIHNPDREWPASAKPLGTRFPCYYALMNYRTSPHLQLLDNLDKEWSRHTALPHYRIITPLRKHALYILRHQKEESMEQTRLELASFQVVLSLLVCLADICRRPPAASTV